MHKFNDACIFIAPNKKQKLHKLEQLHKIIQKAGN